YQYTACPYLGGGNHRSRKSAVQCGRAAARSAAVVQVSLRRRAERAAEHRAERAGTTVTQLRRHPSHWLSQRQAVQRLRQPYLLHPLAVVQAHLGLEQANQG